MFDFVECNPYIRGYLTAARLREMNAADLEQQKAFRIELQSWMCIPNDPIREILSFGLIDDWKGLLQSEKELPRVAEIAASINEKALTTLEKFTELYKVFKNHGLHIPEILPVSFAELIDKELQLKEGEALCKICEGERIEGCSPETCGFQEGDGIDVKMQKMRTWLDRNREHLLESDLLNLSNLDLEAFPREIGNYFPNLILLDLSCNALKRITVPVFTRLEHLYLENNQLESLDLPPLPALESLLLSQNRLASLVLPPMPSLKNLFLNHNRLIAFHATGFPKLYALFLDRNALESVTIPELAELEVLELSFNQLTALRLPKLPRLTSLYASFNLLREVELSDELPLLGAIGMYHNRLEVFVAPPLRSLLKLDLSSNELCSLEISCLNALQKLSLQRNQLPSLSISSLPNLKCLQLYDNPLESLPTSGTSKPLRVVLSADQMRLWKLPEHAKFFPILHSAESGR